MIPLLDDDFYVIFVGGKIGYLRLLETSNLFLAGFLGVKIGVFRLEFSYPFPWISLGVIF